MRNHNVDGVRIPFTAAEETAADIVDAAHLAAKPSRDAQAEINRLEALESPRRLAEAFADPTWLNANRALIATERSKL
jgi:hypothetical protein|tara:strand:+ start:536 stop:769 length:234 start_codon:yes stop_codon:yes gene_type:complete